MVFPVLVFVGCVVPYDTNGSQQVCQKIWKKSRSVDRKRAMQLGKPRAIVSSADAGIVGDALQSSAMGRSSDAAI
jgi:hypothetical protein